MRSYVARPLGQSYSIYQYNYIKTTSIIDRSRLPHAEEMLSYKSVVGHYHLSDSQLREKCNEKVLEALAPKLGEWRDIRPHLGVDRNVGTAIEHDQPTEEAKRRQLLYRWKQINGHQATYEKLIRALMQASRTDLAGTVCEIYASTGENYLLM